MKNIITITSLLIALTSFSKPEQTEFEGVIHYEKTVTRLSNNKKAVSYEKYVNELLGAKSDFYYKSGNHLWHRLLTDGKELMLNKSKYLYVKENAEYINWRKSKVSKANEEITSIKIISEVDTILGYPCQVLEVKSRLLPLSYGTKMYRKFYFNSEKFYVNYKYLKHYKMNSQNEIFKMLQCLPLRIYVEIHGVVLDYVAQSVEFKKLDDNLFQVPPTHN